MYWSIYQLILDQVLVECRPCIGRCSVDTRLMYLPILLSVDIVGPDIGRYMGRKDRKG